MGSSARAGYLELCAEVDAFFSRVLERHRGSMSCAPGCASCCRARFSVAPIEAAAIEEGLDALPRATRRAIAERAARGDPDVCPALGEDGRCDIYAIRPLACRSHGLPIQRREPDRRLPVVEACPLNFDGGDPARVAEEDVLDSAALCRRLGALDASLAAEEGREIGRRIELAEILRRCAGDTES